MELWQDSQQKWWKIRSAVAVSTLSTRKHKNPLHKKYKLERLYISNMVDTYIYYSGVLSHEISGKFLLCKWNIILTNMKYYVMPQVAKSAYATQTCIGRRRTLFSLSLPQIIYGNLKLILREI